MLLRNAALAVSILIIPATASAAVLDFAFTGMVESTNDGANQSVASIGALNSGDGVSGSFRYDSSLLSPVSGTEAVGVGAITDFILTIDGFTYTSGAAGTARVRNDHMAGSSAPLRDMFIASAGGVSGPTQGGLVATGLQFSLGGTAAVSVLDDIDPPTVAEFLALLANDNNDGNTKFLTFADGSDVRFDVATVNISAVPLPAGGLLLLTGLAGLGLARRRRK